MFQKFATDTLVSRFIKNLVYSTQIPKYKFVSKGDWITADCLYCFNTNVIRCTTSGFVGAGAKYKAVNKFYIKDPDVLVSNISELIANKTLSKNTYYDYETHEQLGEYLRYIRGIYGIDLMPFYNCFSGRYSSTFYIKDGKYHEGINDNVQIALLPIKFNKTYTIAVDCEGVLDILPVMFSGGIPLKMICDGLLTDLSEALEGFHVQKCYSQFNKPFTYSLDIKDSSLAKFFEQNERCLHLAIQLPIKNTSSLTILEGDYTNLQANRIIDTAYVDRLTEKEINEVYLSELSLLKMNDTNSYAFSDRLVEYLLKNVIDPSEEIDGNIVLLQGALGLLDSPNISRGVWSNILRYDAYNVYKSLYTKNSSLEFIDINGFTDKDVEKVLNGGV